MSLIGALPLQTTHFILPFPLVLHSNMALIFFAQ